MSEPELLPCPFCGGTNLTVYKCEEDNLWLIQCHALDCKAEQWGFERETVVARWNRRTLISQTPATPVHDPALTNALLVEGD